MPVPGQIKALADTVWMSPSELFFDETNPRLSGRRSDAPDQDGILELLWREFSVDEVALSIAANGFFSYEPLFVVEEVLPSTGELCWIVVEGNRRLAAVWLLLNIELRRKLKATDLPTPSAEAKRTLEALPVIVCKRDEIWRFVGFKHVNGPQPWDALSKAEYIAWVHNELDEPLSAIANQIGDKNATVLRLYNALMALRQAEGAGVFNRDNRYNKHFSFSHLYTGLGYAGVQAYLGMSSSKVDQGSTRPIPKAKMTEFGQLCLWLFGNKQNEVRPLVRSQNPDLRRLDEALQNRQGVVALESGLGLTVSVDIAKGDDRILRESLVEAKSLLQTAKARIVTGFKGEAEMIQSAQDIFALAESIVDEMASRRQKPRSR